MARLAEVEAQPASSGKCVVGRNAGQRHYFDNIFKSVETDEELREYGFDLLADAKAIEKPTA